MKKIKKIALPIILGVTAITTTACSQGSQKTYVTSKAGDVKESEILEYIGSQQVSKVATDIAIKKVLLDKYKDKIDNKIIDEQFAEAEKQYGGKEAFEATLKQQGFNSDKFKEALKVRVAQAYMINDYNSVSEDKIKETFETEKTQFNIAHILIAVKSDAAPNGLSDEDAKKKAEEILKKVKDGEDFAKLAKENSSDTANANNGGELGWSAKNSTSFVKEFADVAYSLKKGELSQNVVKTPFGYHIIKVLDTRELEYEKAKSSIVEKIAQDSVSKDASIYSKALQKIFDEYQLKGDTSEVKSYISDMLSGNTQKTQ